MNTDVTKFLPLKPLQLNTLLALGERPHHGYSLMRILKEDPRFTAPVHTGPLYRLLKNLLEAGLVVERTSPPDAQDDDARRGAYYELSSLGKAVLRAELTRLRAVVEFGTQLGLAEEKAND